jgi:hypothetical protein
MYDKEAYEHDIMPRDIESTLYEIAERILSDDVPEPARTLVSLSIREGLRRDWQALRIDIGELGAALGLWPTFETWLEERDTAARERAIELMHEARTGNDARV